MDVPEKDHLQPLSAADKEIATALLARHINPNHFQQIMRHVVTGQRLQGTDETIAEAKELVNSLRLMLALAEWNVYYMELSKLFGVPVES